MSNKHTPVPWIIKSEPSDCKDYTELNITFPGIDASVGARKKAIDPFVIATVNSVYFWPHDEEPEANARLIAAAPELLAALLGLVNLCTHPKSTKAEMKMIANEYRKVIQKATKP